MKKTINTKEKEKINYTRDYRHLEKIGILYMLQMMILLVPLIVVYLCLYTKMTQAVADFSAYIISEVTGKTTSLVKLDYLPVFGGVYCVKMSGKSPSFTFAIISCMVSLILILCFSVAKNKNKPLMIFFTIASWVHFVSSLYFVFFTRMFPYNLNDYSELYIKQQVIIWMIIMTVYVLTTSMIPDMFVYRVGLFMALMILEFLYGVVRYVIYMVIIAEGTYIFMAVLFFVFGIMFDFLILVAVYSVYIYVAGFRYKNKKRGDMWQWS